MLCLLGGAAGIWALLHAAAFWLQPWRPERTVVSSRYIFGPYPVEPDFIALKEQGVTTVISLLGPMLPYERVLLAQETVLAEKHGMRVLNFPMASILGQSFGKDYLANSRAAAQAALDSPGPVYVHGYLELQRTAEVRSRLEAELANARPKKPPPQTPLGRASLAFDEGRFEDCLRELAQAKLDEPDASVLEGWAHYRRNRTVEARAAFERAVSARPEHWDAHAGLGYSALRDNDLATAEHEFGLVRAGQPDNAAALEGLGYVRNRQGEHAEARDLFAQALELAPDNRDVRSLYEKLRNAERHVVLVIVDGLRPDALGAAPAPQIQELAASGASSMTAKAVGRPETVAGFTTILSGLPPGRHGVFRGSGKSLDLPTLFTRVRETGGRAALYSGKGEVSTLAAPGSVEVSTKPADSATLAGQFAQDFPRRAFELAVIHLRDPDVVGHQKGWMKDDYLAAVREADAAVGTIRRAIADSGVADRTTIILTADHGGEDKTHDAAHPAAWIIPWICHGPSVRSGSLDDVTLLDTAPTVLASLGLPQLPGVEGKIRRSCIAGQGDTR